VEAFGVNGKLETGATVGAVCDQESKFVEQSSVEDN
jgi:hypothetical protein